MKTNPSRFVLSFVKFLGPPLSLAALLAATVAITRAREGRWEQAILAFSIALACGGAAGGANWWVRFHARAVDPSEQLREANPDAPWMWREDWAAGEVRTSAQRDANRLTVIAIAWCVATFPILLHRAASRAPRRRLLRDTIVDLPADRRRDARMGDAPAASLARIRRVAIRDDVGAGTNRRRAYRLDSYRQSVAARRANRARARMHPAHDAGLLAQPHGLGSDSVAQ